MRAVRFESGGAIKVVQLPNPQPGAEDVLVQVLAAGVCRTDLHLLDEVKAGEHEPLIPGHEMAGRIAKIGDDVYTAKVGDLVGVHFEQPCGRCRQCRRQRTNLCEEGTTLGFDGPGGYAEFVVAKQTTILPLPPNFDPALAAPLGCSGATAYRAVVAFGQAEEEDMVVIIGAGGVGLSAVQVTANDLVDGGKAYLGAYSSTMADFARAISLAEAGRLRPVVTRKAPLADAAEVLNDLRDGKIVGRAVLFPGPMG